MAFKLGHTRIYTILRTSSLVKMELELRITGVMDIKLGSWCMKILWK